MDGRLVCLGCGGHLDEATDAPLGDTPCVCPPPAAEAGALTCPGCGGALHVGARGCPFCASTVATRRCTSCLSWNLAEARHCLRCGKGVSDEEAVPLECQDLGCPRCGTSLSRRRYEDLDTDECDGCGGLFVEPPMMDRLVAARDASTHLRLALPERSTSRETKVRYVPCPRCGTRMNRRMFGRISGVVVDVCRDHGVWFDPGELTEVLAFIERGGLERARMRELEDLAEAAGAARSERARAAFAPMSHAGALEQRGAGRPADSTLFHAVLEALAGLWR